MFVVSVPQLGAPVLQVVGLRSARILTIPLSRNVRPGRRIPTRDLRFAKRESRSLLAGCAKCGCGGHFPGGRSGVRCSLRRSKPQ